MSTRTSASRSLYHGTLIDHKDSIERLGLIPQVGQFVRDAYEPGEEYGNLDDQDAVYMADKRDLDKSLTAMRHNVSNKLGIDFHDVTENHLRNHGLLVKLPSRQGYGPDETGLSQHDEWGYGDSPSFAEDQDWHSRNAVRGVKTLHGPVMMRYLNKQGLLPLNSPRGPAPQRLKPEIGAPEYTSKIKISELLGQINPWKVHMHDLPGYSEGHFDHRPALVYPTAKQIIVGQPGTHHTDLYENKTLPHQAEQPRAIEIEKDGKLSIMNNALHERGGELAEALRPHVPNAYSGSDDSWKFASDLPEVRLYDGDEGGHGTGDRPWAFDMNRNVVHVGPKNAYHDNLQQHIFDKHEVDIFGKGFIHGRSGQFSYNPRTRPVLDALDKAGINTDGGDEWKFGSEGVDRTTVTTHDTPPNVSDVIGGTRFIVTKDGAKTAGTQKWTPGNSGKGLVTDEGDVHTWNTDRFDGPHHADIAEQIGLRHVPASFEITPQGKWDSWWGGDTMDHLHHHLGEKAPHLTFGRDPSYDDWKFSGKALKIRSLHPEDPTPEDLADDDMNARRPFIYHQPSHSVYIGGPGQHHSEVQTEHMLPQERMYSNDQFFGSIMKDLPPEGNEENYPNQAEWFRRVPENHEEVLNGVAEHQNTRANHFDPDADDGWEF